MTPPSITLYHNPRCSKSRETLALINAAGYEPQIVEYLKTPLDKAALNALVERMGVPVRELLRTGEDAYKTLSLGDVQTTDEAIYDAMVEYPILMNRPIVATAKGACICRPPERVQALLP